MARVWCGKCCSRCCFCGVATKHGEKCGDIRVAMVCLWPCNFSHPPLAHSHPLTSTSIATLKSLSPPWVPSSSQRTPHAVHPHAQTSPPVPRRLRYSSRRCSACWMPTKPPPRPPNPPKCLPQTPPPPPPTPTPPLHSLDSAVKPCGSIPARTWTLTLAWWKLPRVWVVAVVVEVVVVLDRSGAMVMRPAAYT